MTPEEKIAAKKIARIIRAARKQLSLNQESVSTRLGISQSALSKLEHGTLIPSAPQWFSFCRMTGITTDSLLTGCIERNRPAIVQQGDREGTFKIPKRYAFHRGSKVRAMLPFLNYLQTCLGEKKRNEFLKSLKIDPDFFIDLDNQLNLQFILDVSRHLIRERLLKPADVVKLTKFVTRPEAHGSLHQRYTGGQGPINLLTSLIMNARYYECNFIYRLEDQKPRQLDFSIEPEEHLENFSYRNDPDLGDFLCRYKRSYFEQFTLFGEGPGARMLPLQELECHYKGSTKCVYRLTLPGDMPS